MLRINHKLKQRALLKRPQLAPLFGDYDHNVDSNEDSDGNIMI